MVGGGVWGAQVKKLKREVVELPPAQAALYRARYPALASLDPYLVDLENEFVPPEGNVIARNLCVGGRWLDIVWGAEARHLQLGENLVDADLRFVAPAQGDFRLREDSPAWAIGFAPIPFETIGLVPDADRPGARGASPAGLWEAASE
jgi:hypothetical protein